MHSTKRSINNYFSVPLFMLFFLYGIIWASTNFSNAPRPGLRPTLPEESFPNNSGSILTLCLKMICSTPVATGFYFTSSLASFRDASSMYGGPQTNIFCGVCLYSVWLTPNQYWHYSGGTISHDTMKEILYQTAGVIYLPGYTLLEPKLWEDSIGMSSEASWGHLVDSKCGIEDWGVTQMREMGTGVHLGSVWDWGSLLRWYCKTWSVSENGERLRKYWYRVCKPWGPLRCRPRAGAPLA